MLLTRSHRRAHHGSEITTIRFQRQLRVWISILAVLSSQISPDDADMMMSTTGDAGGSSVFARASARIQLPSEEKSILRTPPCPPSPMHCTRFCNIVEAGISEMVFLHMALFRQA